MATEVKLPELGENVPGGQVVDIKVSPGAEVREGQPLVEVEADKASVEVPDPHAKDGKRKVAVNIGISNGAKTELLSGLKENDQVVLQ